MPRHFTPTEKQIILDLLAANAGDVPRTAAEVGITPRTLYQWRKAALDSQSASANLKNLANLSPQVTESVNQSDSQNPALVAHLTHIHDRMVEEIDRLLNAIPYAVEHAPLNQIVTALTQLIEYRNRLSAQLPPEPTSVEYEVAFHVEKTEDLDDEQSEEETAAPEAS